MDELERVLKAKKDFVTLEKLYREILVDQRAKFGSNDSLVVAETLNSLAASLQSQGKQAATVEPLREALDILLKQRGQESSKLPSAVQGIASLLVSQGRPDEASKLYEECLRDAPVTG